MMATKLALREPTMMLSGLKRASPASNQWFWPTGFAEPMEREWKNRFVQHSNIARPMSQMGPKADIAVELPHVRFGSKSGHRVLRVK